MKLRLKMLYKSKIEVYDRKYIRKKFNWISLINEMCYLIECQKSQKPQSAQNRKPLFLKKLLEIEFKKGESFEPVEVKYIKGSSYLKSIKGHFER